MAPAATALIRPLAWEPPYAAAAALEKAKRQKVKKKKKKKNLYSLMGEKVVLLSQRKRMYGCLIEQAPG